MSSQPIISHRIDGNNSIVVSLQKVNAVDTVHYNKDIWTPVEPDVSNNQSATQNAIHYANKEFPLSNKDNKIDRH